MNPNEKVVGERRAQNEEIAGTEVTQGSVGGAFHHRDEGGLPR